MVQLLLFSMHLISCNANMEMLERMTCLVLAQASAFKSIYYDSFPLPYMSVHSKSEIAGLLYQKDFPISCRERDWQCFF